MLHVRQWGSVVDAPLVFLHGFMGDSADWSKIAGAIGHPCFAVDLPGHGDSIGQPDAAYSLSGAADLILATLDAVGVRDFDLCGYSMGGRIALSVVRAAPERVRRLILESSHPGLGSAEERLERLSADRARAEQLRASALGDFVRDWYAAPLFASLAARPKLLARVIEERSSQQPLELARALAGFSLGTQLDARTDGTLGAIPTLLISGDSDEGYSTLLAGCAESLEGLQHVSVPVAGHNVHLEAPAAYRATLETFLS